MDFLTTDMIDLTVPMGKELPSFPGYPGFEYEQWGGHDKGGGALMHYYSANTHQGTHIDAPYHFIPDGRTVDELTFEELVGPAKVMDLRKYKGESITADILDNHASEIKKKDKVVMVTGDVDDNFFTGNFFKEASDITLDAAEWLIERAVELIVNDFLTEAVPGEPDRPVHKALLGADIPVVEYICNIEEIVGYESIWIGCFPMLVKGFEGTPTRVVARAL